MKTQPVDRPTPVRQTNLPPAKEQPPKIALVLLKS
jgi:hypothetical protein